MKSIDAKVKDIRDILSNIDKEVSDLETENDELSDRIALKGNDEELTRHLESFFEVQKREALLFVEKNGVWVLSDDAKVFLKDFLKEYLSA